MRTELTQLSVQSATVTVANVSWLFFFILVILISRVDSSEERSDHWFSSLAHKDR